MVKKMLLMGTMLILAACGGGGESSSVPPTSSTLNSSAAKTSSLSVGDVDCPAGGILVETGIDKNGNGLLDTSEVTSSQKVCNGATGSAGPAGSSASATRIIASIFCTGLIPSSSLYASYNAVQFSNGIVYASGNISGLLLQSSGTVFYTSSQVGYTTAPVNVTYDATGTANGGWWKMSLDRTTLITSLEYNDSDLVGGKANWTMTADKCVSNFY